MSGRKTPTCPVHRLEMVPRESKYGKFLSCPCWPNCDIMGTWHSWTQQWLVSDAATRDARKSAHDVFDSWWREERIPRRRAYEMLAEGLGVPRGDCHIRLFDEDTCFRVIDWVLAQPIAADASTSEEEMQP